MVNLSLCEGIMPDHWKTALVLPLLKKLGLYLIFKDFRPVINLPFVAMSAKKVVISQLCIYIYIYIPTLYAINQAKRETVSYIYIYI